MLPASSVIIATANRPEPLRETLATLAAQTVPPGEVVVVDASDAGDSQAVVSQLEATYPARLVYCRAEVKGAAAQRNQGAEIAGGDVLFFLDDDLVIEPAFVEEILRAFAVDGAGQVGGISGTITNQTYGSPSRWSRLFFRLMAGEKCATYAGRVIGPAINLLPADTAHALQPVEWLPSGVVAYRAEVFHAHRFGSFFTGYSFAEDLHLSARVAKTHRLYNCTRARVFHKDLGGGTHRNWPELGKMQVVNRWVVMVDVLGRRTFTHRCKFLLALLFFSAADLVSSVRRGGLRQKLGLVYGRAAGCWAILRGATPA